VTPSKTRGGAASPHGPPVRRRKATARRTDRGHIAGTPLSTEIGRDLSSREIASLRVNGCDRLSGLWLAQATLLNPGQPPRVNGSSTRSTNPTLRQVTTCRSTSEDRHQIAAWSRGERGKGSGGATETALEGRLQAALQVPAGCPVQRCHSSDDQKASTRKVNAVTAWFRSGQPAGHRS
jgi:hypothetical protein